MSARIVIELNTESTGDFGVSVDVSGELNTLEAIALFEVAKLQHLQSKHTRGPAVHVEMTPGQ